MLNLLIACFCSLSTPSQLSLEEKVGQMLMVHFHGEEANEEARGLIQETKVGGIIYYNWSNSLSSPQQVQKLSTDLQKMAQESSSQIPLLITTDQEGGAVARLKQGFTEFPGNRALGMTGDPTLAEQSALAMGKELLAVGINMNLAPVADVNTNPLNPVIGIRSFGSDPQTVLPFVESALKGYHASGIITTLKHFPGHGDVTVDSHADLPIVQKSLEELEKGELLLFTKLASQTDAIMTAHLLVPCLDTSECTSLSEKTLAYLRQHIGFDGVIIADSLIMEGVLKKRGSIDETVIQAIQAGCDILLLGGKQLIGKHTDLELTPSDVKRIHQAIVTAVKTGRIAEEKINKAVERILNLKQRYLKSERPAPLIHAEAHQALAHQIASQALKTSTAKAPLNLQEKTLTIIAPLCLQNSLSQTPIPLLGKIHYFHELNVSSQESLDALQAASEADILLLCTYNAWKDPSQKALIQSLSATKKPFILLVTGDPLDETLFPEAQLLLTTFSPVTFSLHSAYTTIINYLN